MSQQSGNSLKDDADSLLAFFTNAGNAAGGIYSTFLNAQANLTIAQAQKAEASKPSGFSPEQEDMFNLGTNTMKYVVYGAIGLAILAGGVFLIKTVKKG